MAIVLYSTGCPRCNVLKKKMEASGIPFEVRDDIDEMIEMGIESAPVLVVYDKQMDFTEAVTWLRDFGAQATAQDFSVGCDACKLN